MLYEKSQLHTMPTMVLFGNSAFPISKVEGVRVLKGTKFQIELIVANKCYYRSFETEEEASREAVNIAQKIDFYYSRR